MPELELILSQHANVVIAGSELSVKVGSLGSSSLTSEALPEIVRDCLNQYCGLTDLLLGERRTGADHERY